MSTRDLLLLFFLAKGLALVVAFLLVGRGHEDALALTTQVAALTLFLGIASASAKCSVSALLRSAVFIVPGIGKGWFWLIAALPIGLLLRFGVEGGVLGFMTLVDAEMARAEFDILWQKHEKGDFELPYISVLAAMAAAVSEEVIYRKFLLTQFASRYGLTTAIVLVSALFGLLHLNPITALAGVGLALVYLLSGRIYVAILAHVAANLAHPLLAAAEIALEWRAFLGASMFCAVVVLVMGWWAWSRVQRVSPVWSELPDHRGLRAPSRRLD